MVDEVREWTEALEQDDFERIFDAIDLLREHGPGLGRPMVDTIKGSMLKNLEELRQGTVRIPFAFDPWRSCILLVAGDKANRWKVWYEDAIPLAEDRYRRYVKDREAGETR
ncbi:type II toxin-antitoxin system RelE/ParE family toxin [Glycomyces sp. A-F 0318]|uniref:type II toxin-antitoxin system RelE/ParE family toxin n=1 Tax=Glycomyces amatae TaxID=2881355 RepID=UPI001E486D06|nr:type II toxin-antitoxin system RelE/ParE family toxin [Glycomyces amatae]MCD0445596.1 type II toxin-antitoxin system RelE/ParE family toxin [Glycomyces amatae]